MRKIGGGRDSDAACWIDGWIDGSGRALESAARYDAQGQLPLHSAQRPALGFVLCVAHVYRVAFVPRFTVLGSVVLDIQERIYSVKADL